MTWVLHYHTFITMIELFHNVRCAGLLWSTAVAELCCCPHCGQRLFFFLNWIINAANKCNFARWQYSPLDSLVSSVHPKKSGGLCYALRARRLISTVGLSREDPCWAGWRSWSAGSASVLLLLLHRKNSPGKIIINNRNPTNLRCM